MDGRQSSNNDPPPRHNGRGNNKSQKAFAGVSHTSKGSGATVGYLYPGIRAKGLMSVTSPHPMVKDATAASSDPQGLGHALSDSEDKVSASSDPKAWAPTRPIPRGGLRLVRPPRVGFRLARSTGRDFRLARSLGSDLLPNKSSGPRGDPNCFNHYGVEAHA